jgi:hypothetical protein
LLGAPDAVPVRRTIDVNRVAVEVDELVAGRKGAATDLAATRRTAERQERAPPARPLVSRVVAT